MASSPPPRPRGRPARPDAELRAAALEAATWLLLNEGYAAATLEAVARRAGMAKKTVYRFAANREDLVAQVVRGWTDTFVPVMAQEVGGAADVLPALARVLQAIADRALSAEAVGMFRLLTADFPARAALLAGWFEKLAARGLIRIKEPRATAGLLLAMTIAEPLRQMALGLAQPLPQGSIADRIQACVALFSGQGRVFEVLPD